MTERSQKDSTEESSKDSNSWVDNEIKAITFDLEMAEVIWQKVKGISIPESYSVADRLHILQRYWHRAMEKE